MRTLSESSFFRFLTPAHRRPVEEHLLRDEATKKLLTQTENLLDNIIQKSDGYNRKRSIRRKQKEFHIKVKITHKLIKVTLSDTKHSRSPVHKQFNIVCYRKYRKAKNGIGVCKEATIHYVKDGRAHIRSIRDSSLFHGIFFRIHRLDEAYVHGGERDKAGSLELLATQERRLLDTQSDDLKLLYEESKRYVDSVKQFSVDPLIENRLLRLLTQVSKLQDDFDLLDYEEKHIVRRMLREDIPKLLNTFLSLSLTHQLEQKEKVFVALSQMELTIIDYQNQLEKARVERMNHLLRLQELRYRRDPK